MKLAKVVVVQSEDCIEGASQLVIMEGGQSFEVKERFRASDKQVVVVVIS